MNFIFGDVGLNKNIGLTYKYTSTELILIRYVLSWRLDDSTGVKVADYNRQIVTGTPFDTA